MFFLETKTIPSFDKETPQSTLYILPWDKSTMIAKGLFGNATDEKFVLRSFVQCLLVLQSSLWSLHASDLALSLALAKVIACVPSEPAEQELIL